MLNVFDGMHTSRGRIIRTTPGTDTKALGRFLMYQFHNSSVNDSLIALYLFRSPEKPATVGTDRKVRLRWMTRTVIQRRDKQR